MTQAQVYVHARALAPAKRANPDEGRTIARLAVKAQELAAEHGEVLARRDALIRVRENLAYVHQLALVKEMGL